MSNSTRTRDIVGFIAFLGVCVAVLGICGAATTTSVRNW
jgi:hypothetical protein